MPEVVFLNAKKNCRGKSKIGLLATDVTIKTGIYNYFFNKRFNLISPTKKLQIQSVNKSIKLVKMGKTKDAEKALKPAVNYLLKMNCKKIILGCTELPIAIFAYKSFKKAKLSRIFMDPNLILAEASMKKYK
jgi:aspartate racemase